MKPAWRKGLLLGMLVLSVAAAVWVSDPKYDIVDDNTTVIEPEIQVNRSSDVFGKSPQVMVDLQLNQLTRLSKTSVTLMPNEKYNKNPFGIKSWFVPPPTPAPKPLPIPKPDAPPLPFAFVGKLNKSAEHWVVYLTKGEQLFSVSQGETFDNTYSLDGIENGNLVITYIPLSIKQLLPIEVN
jgi:hypothetical protein